MYAAYNMHTYENGQINELSAPWATCPGCCHQEAAGGWCPAEAPPCGIKRGRNNYPYYVAGPLL